MKIFILFMLAIPVFSEVTWPPDTCNCAKWHRENVENPKECPNNEVIRVSHDGSNGTMKFSAFLAIAGLIDNRTYIIEASPRPYIFGCLPLDISGSQTRKCVIIRGETGNREDVVLAGADPAVDPDFWKTPEYGGPGSCGMSHFIALARTANIVIADLTIRNSPGKMIKIDGGDGFYPENIVLHNLELQDCGSQMIKGAAGDYPVSTRHGILECSFLHYTDRLFDESTYETQAIDFHRGKQWIIRENYFLNIRQYSKNGNADGILMWNQTDSLWIYNNLFVNNNMAMKLGLQNTGNHFYVWNNVIVYDETDSRMVAHTQITMGSTIRDGFVCHNTLWNPEQSSVLVSCASSVINKNNLYLNGSQGGGITANNIRIGNGSWFEDVNNYNFRLTQNRPVARIPQVTEDIEGKPRPVQTSAGAFEFTSAAALDFSNMTSKGEDIRIVPNPFSTSVEISVVRSEQRAVSKIQMVEIYSINGKLINQLKPLTAHYSLLTTGCRWHAQDQPGGIYIVKVRFGRKIYTNKICLIK
jgi:hypothetical protein